jgi:hypothetical protein
MHAISILAASEFGDSSILLFLASIVVTFTATWLVSKLFAGERGTFQNTVVYYIYHFVATLILAVGAYVLFNTFPNGEGAILTVVVFAALWLALWIPMRIYEIGVLRAFCFVIVAAIGGAVASLVLGGSVLIFQLKRSGFSFADAGKATPTVMLTDQRDLSTKVNQLYAELQRERSVLNNGDPVAVAQFNVRVAEYNNLRSQLVTAKR